VTAKKVLGKMLEWSVQHRYQTANEVLKAFNSEHMDSQLRACRLQSSNGPSSSGDAHTPSSNQIAARIPGAASQSGVLVDQIPSTFTSYSAYGNLKLQPRYKPQKYS